MNKIEPPIDLQETKYYREFQEALNIKNYFDLIDYCEKKKSTICDDPGFWKEKLSKDYLDYIRNHYYQIDNLSGNQFKAKYQAILSDSLLQFINYRGHYPEYDEDFRELNNLYGDDEEKLEIARELRKEANKAFPMEYDKTLYKIYVRDDPEDPEYGPEQNDIDEETERLGIANKPGQLILIYNLEGIPKKYRYMYQIGDEIFGWITEYPEISDEIYQDTPRNKIKEIYGINPRSEKL